LPLLAHHVGQDLGSGDVGTVQKVGRHGSVLDDVSVVVLVVSLLVLVNSEIV
jgi:hypothetical protein